ncbi:AFG1-like ATPase-domain-containing protein [Epithele typhae]|uniref:AFG1-like ATPase-domain-containing protein n=1 Tax=Epithele typhae TaxID=378194 RepID=UPI0020084188|nr:AFG1-like ATPase-domain-containing protein [Epithele typhae]KAH9942379.1 AFG1-like ATPase-domain-containing protein [Epithele typhae]
MQSRGQLPAQIDLLERYRGLVALGRVREDEEQIRVIMQLRRLHKELNGYSPPAVLARHLNLKHGPWWKTEDDTTQPPSNTLRELIPVRTHAEEIDSNLPYIPRTNSYLQGLLITGPPGSGKSFLTDLWFSTLPTPYKARKHYNELVLEIYRAVWEETRRRMTALHAAPGLAKAAIPPRRRSRTREVEQARPRALAASRPVRLTPHSLGSPLRHIAYAVARRLVLRHWLLVLDEVQLLDVSSATLLADVLSWFWRMGGVVVGSSNRVPDDLYRNGVQRERLEPFVEALKARCPVIVMRAERDWRVFGAALADLMREGDEHVGTSDRGHGMSTPAFVGGAVDVQVFGRRIRVPWAANGCFPRPCDYITSPRASTLVLTDVPVLHLSAKNQARRFISLIDALYEARCRIVVLAEAAPEDLSSRRRRAGRMRDGVDVMMAEAVAETQDVYRPNVSSYDAPNMAEEPRAPTSALALDTLSIFSGKDEQFAFKRALSRLLEMTSEEYARDETWAPLPAALRKWERTSAPAIAPASASAAASPPSSPPSTSRPLSSPSSPPPSLLALPQGDDSDFGEEASVHGHTHAPPNASAPSSHTADRPPAPQLSADHVWGVREDWGPRARTWGRGAAAYDRGAQQTEEDREDGSGRSRGAR